MNFIFLIINVTCLVCIHKQECRYQGEKINKNDLPLWWSAGIWLRYENRIMNRMCRSYIYESFWNETLHKDSFFSLPTCSISYRHLYWNIPAAPWQGRTRRFPFQTGLSCPSNHQGSLRKYIPSVEAWGEREWMEASRGRSEEEVFKATGGLLPRGFSGR